MLKTQVKDGELDGAAVISDVISPLPAQAANREESVRGAVRPFPLAPEPGLRVRARSPVDKSGPLNHV